MDPQSITHIKDLYAYIPLTPCTVTPTKKDVYAAIPHKMFWIEIILESQDAYVLNGNTILVEQNKLNILLPRWFGKCKVSVGTAEKFGACARSSYWCYEPFIVPLV